MKVSKILKKKENISRHQQRENYTNREKQVYTRICSRFSRVPDKFCYLGTVTLITNDNKCCTEIRRRITLVKRVFLEKMQLLINKFNYLFIY